MSTPKLATTTQVRNIIRAVGAINALTNLVKRSDASTIMELEIVLKDAQEQLQKVAHRSGLARSSSTGQFEEPCN